MIWFQNLQEIIFKNLFVSLSAIFCNILEKDKKNNNWLDILSNHFVKFVIIDIESLPNRLLKFCYVAATSANLPRVSFFFSFLFFVAVAIYRTNKANKAGGTCH
jgi:hypothetical protein